MHSLIYTIYGCNELQETEDYWNLKERQFGTLQCIYTYSQQITTDNIGVINFANADWMINWLIDWMIDWLIDNLTNDWHSCSSSLEEHVRTYVHTNTIHILQYKTYTQ